MSINFKDFRLNTKNDVLNAFSNLAPDFRIIVIKIAERIEVKIKNKMICTLTISEHGKVWGRIKVKTINGGYSQKHTVRGQFSDFMGDYLSKIKEADEESCSSNDINLNKLRIEDIEKIGFKEFDPDIKLDIKRQRGSCNVCHHVMFVAICGLRNGFTVNLDGDMDPYGLFYVDNHRIAYNHVDNTYFLLKDSNDSRTPFGFKLENLKSKIDEHKEKTHLNMKHVQIINALLAKVLEF